MRIRRLRRLSGPLLLAFVAAVVGAYIGLAWMRSEAIEEMSAVAQATYAGDRVEALLEYLESDRPSLEEKNRAIWVLGELRDERALGPLRALLVSDECDHARMVCQREVRKSIRKITGEVPNPYF